MKRALLSALYLWGAVWSVIGPVSFLMWCSFAYGWFS